MRFVVCLLAAVVAVVGWLLSPASADASPYVRYGFHDDAWLLNGDATLDSRLDELDRLGVDIVRWSVRWDQVARREPATPSAHTDPAYDWSSSDRVLHGLRAHGIAAVVTLVGTPGWANGGRPSNWAPTSGTAFASFVRAAATRYPWIRAWTIWNEPNQARWLRPTSPRVYVDRLLNPAYAELHAAIRGVRVGGGVTAPRAGVGGVSPVAWIRGMRAEGARFDAYAHHPYPMRPTSETPWAGGCGRCTTLTMADLDRLLAEVRRNFGAKRVWLTEYGYQTNPPDRILGVTPSTQARHVADAARRAYLAPRVDMLIFFLVRDDSSPDGWQSGVFTAGGATKPAYTAFRLPLVQTARAGGRTVLWGQVRPGSGKQPYRIRQLADGRWRWLGPTRTTDRRGFLAVSVPADDGAVLQLWSPRDRISSLPFRTG
jgi:hypothetical protein